MVPKSHYINSWSRSKFLYVILLFFILSILWDIAMSLLEFNVILKSGEDRTYLKCKARRRDLS